MSASISSRAASSASRPAPAQRAQHGRVDDRGGRRHRARLLAGESAPAQGALGRRVASGPDGSAQLAPDGAGRLRCCGCPDARAPVSSDRSRPPAILGVSHRGCQLRRLRQGAGLRPQHLALAPAHQAPLEPEHPDACARWSAGPRSGSTSAPRASRPARSPASTHGFRLNDCQPPAPAYGARRRARPPPRPTLPTTLHAIGRSTSGGKVATSAWSSPPVSSHCQRVGVQRARGVLELLRHVERVRRRARTETPLAAATWPRSATRPSLTSIIAVAPSAAARGPSAYGGAGRRCASTRTRGDRNPRLSTARPAAAQPSRPATATRSPGTGTGPGDRARGPRASPAR